MFYRRAGITDFSCQTCHGDTGKPESRASVLPNMKVPEEWTKAISWPAERVGHQNVRSSQHRLRGLLLADAPPDDQQRLRCLVAVISFWTDAARRQPAILPDMKRKTAARGD